MWWDDGLFFRGGGALIQGGQTLGAATAPLPPLPTPLYYHVFTLSYRPTFSLYPFMPLNIQSINAKLNSFTTLIDLINEKLIIL